MQVNLKLLIGCISAVNKKSSSLKIVISIIAFLLLPTCIALVWTYKYRGRVTYILLFLAYAIISRVNKINGSPNQQAANGKRRKARRN
jgi:hypothetical protein